MKRVKIEQITYIEIDHEFRLSCNPYCSCDMGTYKSLFPTIHYHSNVQLNYPFLQTMSSENRVKIGPGTSNPSLEIPSIAASCVPCQASLGLTFFQGVRSWSSFHFFSNLGTRSASSTFVIYTIQPKNNFENWKRTKTYAFDESSSFNKTTSK